MTEKFEMNTRLLHSRTEVMISDKVIMPALRGGLANIIKASAGFLLLTTSRYLTTALEEDFTFLTSELAAAFIITPFIDVMG